MHEEPVLKKVHRQISLSEELPLSRTELDKDTDIEACRWVEDMLLFRTVLNKVNIKKLMLRTLSQYANVDFKDKGSLL